MLVNHASARSLPELGLIAHQGGWDEILLIAGPMIAIAALLVVAKRRVDAAAAKQADRSSPDS